MALITEAWVSRERLLLNLILVVGIVVLLELVCGQLTTSSDRVGSFSLPPNQVVDYRTPDFSFTAITNNLGFRGADFALGKSPGRVRIAVLGNSFAYGWGVNIEDTWPVLLQKRFAESGVVTEIANLATPGTTPRTMVEIARRALPILKPDIVLIAALQGSSVITFQPDPPLVERPITGRQRLIEIVRWAVPNLSRTFERISYSIKGPSHISAGQANEAWRNEAATFLKSMSAEESSRYNRLDVETRKRFESGNLNTPIVSQAIRKPDSFNAALQDSGLISTAVVSMRDMMQSIRKVYPPASMVMVSMPYAAYLGQDSVSLLQRLGYTISLSSPGEADQSLVAASRAAGVPFISVEGGFRAANSANLFIPFDGHYSRVGTYLFSRLLSEKLLPLVASP